MKLYELLAIFPACLKAQPQNFSDDALQALDPILANLDQASEEDLTSALKGWMRSHTQERDTLIQFANSNRELSSSRRLPEVTEAGIRQNLYELKTQREADKPASNPPPKDRSNPQD
ncbi:hypothetical protein [Roseofilum sp. Guam]|uniref:hypothetical protein n=1 Tax=Roseofilum sp. Guam TaxID=2821502 RepID=UPI001B1E47AC|nr:hypothetical protein [Roseofilum sp. Guam]MBP0028215.1 hypothetical protein [Roseofilum sp. Guam]